MKKTRPKVLVIENSIGVTGALKSITRTAYDLNDFFEFQFVVPKDSKGISWLHGRHFFIVYELRMKEISRRFFSWLLYFPYLIMNAIKLRKVVSENSIDIIHSNDLYNLLPVALRLIGCNTPYICHIRFLPERFPAFLFKFWFKLHQRHAHKIITVSKRVYDHLPAKKNVVVIHNELPIEEKYPEFNQYSDNENSLIFLYLSNFIQGKGQDFALTAFSNVHMQLPNWRLRFVGGDMDLKKNRAFREKLKQKAKELGIFEKIVWKGFTEDVELEYKRADIVLNFSESESFSITCLEALFFGRPVIATDCGGPSEVIDHQRSGLLVKNRDVDSMSEAMLFLAKENQFREKMGREARVLVRDKFSVEKTSCRLKEVYDGVLSE